jgi:Crp-like helix-turn-helix domain
MERLRELVDGLPAAEANGAVAIVAGSEAIEVEPGVAVFGPALAKAAFLVVEDGFVVLRATFSELSRSMITCEAGPGRIVLPPASEEVLFAIEKARLRPVSDDARDQLLSIPLVAQRVFEQLASTLGEKQEALGMFAQTRHVERVRRKLHQLARSYGHVVRDGIRIDFPITHALLAEMIGSSRETVTRALEELQREGVVVRRGSSYHLLEKPDSFV